MFGGFTPRPKIMSDSPQDFCSKFHDRQGIVIVYSGRRANERDISLFQNALQKGDIIDKPFEKIYHFGGNATVCLVEEGAGCKSGFFLNSKPCAILASMAGIRFFTICEFCLQFKSESVS